jgi:hypothetical protein
MSRIQGQATCRRQSALRVFAERLPAKGKRPKVVITAVMRKPLVLAWTLLRTGQPFSEARLSQKLSRPASMRPGSCKHHY